MFPSLRVVFSGLDPDAVFDVHLDVLPVDDRRYRYAYHKSSWLVAADHSTTSGSATSGSRSVDSGNAEPSPNSAAMLTSFRHPDSPFRGKQLEQRTVSFDRVKLTNSPDRAQNRSGFVRNL